MARDGITHKSEVIAHSGSPELETSGRVHESGGRPGHHHRWGCAIIEGHRFEDFASPSRLLESLLQAAAGIADDLDSRDVHDPHRRKANDYLQRIGAALARLGPVVEIDVDALRDGEPADVEIAGGER